MIILNDVILQLSSETANTTNSIQLANTFLVHTQSYQASELDILV